MPTVASARGRARRTLVAAVAVALAVSAAGATACSRRDADAAGEVVGDGDAYEATIRRTADGVPHITGATLADVSFGQGWANAQDRTCDVADQVMKINGDRALWLGPGEDGANLASDFAWRAIGIVDRAAEDWPTASPDVIELVTGYTAGWNAHLEHVGAEGVRGWCAGADWLRPVYPVEVYAYARAVALEASSGRLLDALAAARPPGAPADRVVDNPPTPAAGLPPTPIPDLTADPADTRTADDRTADTRTAGDPTGGEPPDVPAEDAPPVALAEGDPAGGEPAGTGPPADGAAGADAPGAPTGDGPAGAPDGGLPDPGVAGGWAVGRERSASGGGLLLADPALGWEGEHRLWEVHLTVPGELDVYGAQLSGLPGVLIGFNTDVAWTQVPSPGHRGTAYRLDLVPGEPTAYRYGDGVRRMEATDVTVDVLDDDGSIDQVTRPLWSTHYGPVVELPDAGLAWTEATAVAYRDANLDDDELLDQYLALARAGSLDDVQDAHRAIGGVPYFATVATDRSGRTWYADTSATPNLSRAALDAYAASVAADPQVGRAARHGFVLLDGSEPAFEWVDADGARDPGLVPLAQLPRIERDDYVFSAGDSFWLPHAEATIAGPYSPLVGDQATPRSPRTRWVATLLADTSADGPAGEDGRFSLDELATAALDDRGFTAQALLDAVVDRCDGAPQVFLPVLPGDGGTPDLPPAGVYVGAACAVLADWDGRYALDRAGPPLWRELVHQLGLADLGVPGPTGATPSDGGGATGRGPQWARPFDPRDPVATPAGLAPAPAHGRDPVLDALARAVQILDRSGLPVDATLEDLQFAQRGDESVPVPGGDAADGTAIAVGGGGEASILDPALAVVRDQREPVAAGSPLARYGEAVGYLVDAGSSWLMAVELTDDGPRARTLSPYPQTEDRRSEAYTEATQRYAAREWRDVAFAGDDVAERTVRTTTVRG
ncbi:MAG TPA: penicillin acylase family protein [Acidimicrobiales bacterium]